MYTRSGYTLNVVKAGEQQAVWRIADRQSFRLPDSRVCELLLTPIRKSQQGECLERTRGKMPPGRRDVTGTETMAQSNGEIAQGRQNVGSVSGAQA